MNLNLFLIIIIALIIIFCILLYNGIRIFLTVGKEKGIVKYEFKVTMLKIPIFKRNDTTRIIDIFEESDESENPDEDLEETIKEEKPKSKDESLESKIEDSEGKSKEDAAKDEKKTAESKNETTEDEKKTEKGEDETTEDEEEKSLKEKYEDIKPILKKLINSKEELKSFLGKILKAIDIKRLEGNLILGLSDHSITIKIASWIWSIGAIVNGKKSTLLTVEPKFNEVIIDFEGKIELKLNLLLLLIYSLILLSKKNIRELIKEFL